MECCVERFYTELCSFFSQESNHYPANHDMVGWRYRQRKVVEFQIQTTGHLGVRHQGWPRTLPGNHLGPGARGPFDLFRWPHGELQVHRCQWQGLPLVGEGWSWKSTGKESREIPPNALQNVAGSDPCGTLQADDPWRDQGWKPSLPIQSKLQGPDRAILQGAAGHGGSRWWKASPLTLDWFQEEEELSESSYVDSSSTEEAEANIADKVKKLRKKLKAAEKLETAEKGKKATKAKKDGKKPKVTSKEERRKEAAKGSKDKSPVKKKKKKRKDDESDEPEKAKKRKKRKRHSSSDEKKPRKAMKKKRNDPSSDEPSDDEDLFAGAAAGSKTAKPLKGKDRGPFGSGQAEKFGDDTTEEEVDDRQVFRDAPTQSQAANQMKLDEYSRRKPGRLAARMLLRMSRETALHSVGALIDTRSRMPPVARPYLQTVMTPSLGNKLNVRTSRELLTNCVALDYMAQGLHREAADVLSQRVKALERSAQDGHWQSAQFLELISPDQNSLLERSEQVYLAKEWILDRKVKDYDKTTPKQGGKGDQKGGKGKGPKGNAEKGNKGKDKPETPKGGWRESKMRPSPMLRMLGEDRSSRTAWTKDWKECCQGERSGATVLSDLWETLPSLDTPLGRLAKLLSQESMPPRDSVPKTRGEDLLPIDLAAVDDFLDIPQAEKNALFLIITALNYLWLGGHDSQRYQATANQRLRKVQRAAVLHFLERVRDLGEAETACPDFQAAAAQLVDSKFDYAGEPVMQMEDLIADKVIPVWPEVGSAAVQDVVDYLPSPLREKIMDPRQCLLPIWEWPHRPPKSKVRASQEEWEKIVRAGKARGLMVGVPEEEIFRDGDGNMVLNGAAAVKKLKKIGGETKQMQRFISNFIPTNAYQAHVEGGDQDLPYLGQLTLLEQEDGECWVVRGFHILLQPVQAAKLLAQIHGLWEAGGCHHLWWASWPEDLCRHECGPNGLAKRRGCSPVRCSKLGVRWVWDSWIYRSVKADHRHLLGQLWWVEETWPAMRRGTPRHHLSTTSGIPDHVWIKGSTSEPEQFGKQVVSSVRGSLQGGELQGDLGWYKLATDKQINLLGLGAALLGMSTWHEFDIRHFIGKSIFGTCFRRPLLSVYQHIFDFLTQLTNAGEPTPPSSHAIDEVALTMALVPLMCVHHWRQKLMRQCTAPTLLQLEEELPAPHPSWRRIS